jgi:hypothetical protein
LPKLPAIDKADIEAVRNFLPGKLLSRTAALLSLVVLVLGWVYGVDKALRKLFDIEPSPMWLWYGLLIGVPAAIVLCQLVIEWRAASSRSKTKDLALKVDAVPSGYFRIGPYLNTADDRTKFDRSDRIQEKVLKWILSSESVPLYLTGESGSGKSSLLNAHVLPRLREENWTVVEARAWQDPSRALVEALQKLPTSRRRNTAETADLRTFIEGVARRSDGKLLLVLDQFEEFMILARLEARESFASLISSLRDNPIKGVKLLLVLRSDYQTALEEVGLPLLRQDENWVPVGPFTLAAAKRFMEASGLGFQSEALDRILMSAAELDDTRGMVRPITLNVIGHVLAQGLGAAPSLEADRLVGRYIEQAVEQPGIRDFVQPVLEGLLTEQGTKRPRSEAELANETHLRPGEVRAALNGLGVAALARPLDPARGVWELSHDFIARTVAYYLGRRRRDWWRQATAYLAPALLVLTLATTSGVVVLSQYEPSRIREQLQELGLSSFTKEDGLIINGTPALTNETLTKAGPLLEKLARHIRTLNLSGASLSPRGRAIDIEPLKTLTELQTLSLSAVPVTNIEPLKTLTKLQSLELSFTPVTNIEPLKTLTGLERLNLLGTEVINIEPLKTLTKLKDLSLLQTKVADIEPLLPDFRCST